MAAGERLLKAVQRGVLRPDARLGDARLERIEHDGRRRGRQAAAGAATSASRRAVVTAATGPVGMRAAGLLAQAGAKVTITSRRAEGGAQARRQTSSERFGDARSRGRNGRRVAGRRRPRGLRAAAQRRRLGVRLVPREAWAGRAGLRAAADVNAVPPLGVEGIEASDNGVEREGVTAFGALGIGGLKMKIHKACIARLFERNNLVLDAETILEVRSRTRCS